MGPFKICCCWIRVFFLPCRFMPRPQSVLVIQGLGQGQIKLNGFWQFHTGDDPWWATPSFDDSRWEPITASDSWGNQGHSGYTGFAWYRRHLEISLAPGANTAYALLIPPVDDAYEVYWNGNLIGSYGKLPPGRTGTTLRSSTHLPYPAAGSRKSWDQSVANQTGATLLHQEDCLPARWYLSVLA